MFWPGSTSSVSLGCLPHTTWQANTHVHTLKCANRNSNPDAPPPLSPLSLLLLASLLRRLNESTGTWRGWLEEMKTCLISTATNDDAVLHTLCPLIGLCRSLHLKTHVVPSKPPSPHPQTQTGQSRDKAQGLGRDEGAKAWKE